MRRTNVVQLKPSKQQRKLLKELCTLSSAVYNQANYIVVQAFLNNQKIPTRYEVINELQSHKNYQRLGRSYAQPKIAVHAETINARFKLIKSHTQREVGLPQYYKENGKTTPSPLFINGEGYVFKENRVRIPLSRYFRKEHKIYGDWTIPYNGNLRWEGKQGRGSIHYRDGQYYLHQHLTVEEPTTKHSDVHAAVDLGIITLIAAYTTDEDELLIRDKRFYKQYCFYKKKIQQEHKRLNAQGKNTGRIIRKLYRKRSKYVDNLFKNIVAKLFRFLRRKNVSTLFLGNIKGIRNNSTRNSRVNEMIHSYWSFDKLIKKIKCQAEKDGISTIFIDEAYTSKECPVCFYHTYPKDRIYICKSCGYIDHRDIIGAKNILRYGMRSRQEPPLGDESLDSLKSPHKREMAHAAEEAST